MAYLANHKHYRKRRVTSFLLAAAMVLGMAPVEALATDGHDVTINWEVEQGPTTERATATVTTTLAKDLGSVDVYIRLEQNEYAALTDQSSLVDELPEIEEPGTPGEGGNTDEGDSIDDGNTTGDGNTPDDGNTPGAGGTESGGTEDGATGVDNTPSEESEDAGAAVQAVVPAAFAAPRGGEPEPEPSTDKYIHFTVQENTSTPYTFTFQLPKGESELTINVGDTDDITVYKTSDGAVTEQVSNVIVTTQPIKLAKHQPTYTWDKENTPGVTQTVTWRDNNNQANGRPNYGTEKGNFYPTTISYTIKNKDDETVETGTLYSEGALNQETAAKLGFALDKLPEIKGADDDFTIALPTTLTGTTTDPYTGDYPAYTVEWTMTPPEFENYDLEKAADETTGEENWIYTRVDAFTFTLDLRRGTVGEDEILNAEQIKELLKAFELWGSTNNTTGENESLGAQDFAKFENIEITHKGDDIYTITIPAMPSYNEQGQPLVYWVAEKAPGDGEEAGKLTYGELDESIKGTLLPNAGEGEVDAGDYYAITYNNQGVDDAGSSLDATYSGGSLILTLTGETQYEATKIWLDSGKDANRPNAEFALWRYHEGQEPSSAAPVVWKDVTENGDGGFVTTKELDKLPGDTEPDDTEGEGTEGETGGTEDEPEGQTTGGGSSELPVVQSGYVIAFKDGDDPLNLPKYSPDGERYIYGVREYLTFESGDDNYEQHFGTLNDQGVFENDELPYESGRKPGDDFVYNEGTLSNQRTNTSSAQVVKTWEAAAYQAAFQDVAVEFELQSRVKASGDQEKENKWANVTDEKGAITYVLHNFAAEHLTDAGTYSGLDRYNDDGQELEYRWVETKVYQGVNVDATASQEEVKKALASVTPIEVEENENGDPTFTLKQPQSPEGTVEGTVEVTYRSEAETENNKTTVTNTVEDTVDFALQKVWKGVEENQGDVEFTIYQTLAGTDFNFTKPYAVVTIPGGENAEGKTPSFAEDGRPTDKDVELDVNGATEFNNKNSLTDTDAHNWDAVLKNLPKYDEAGHLYSYMVLETDAPTGYGPHYDNKYYKSTGDYSTVVTNGPGDEITIMVQKNWVDDGDAIHRDPVTLGVYYKNNAETDELTPLKTGDDVKGNTISGSNEKGQQIGTVIAGNKGSWTEFISFTLPNGIEREDLYIVEEKVGNYFVDHGDPQENAVDVPTAEEWEEGYPDGNDKAIFSVTTANHRYQVTYAKVTEGGSKPEGVEALYTVTNRRLGAVDITVDKEWRSGDQGENGNDGITQLANALQNVNEGEGATQYALAFVLDFVKPGKHWEITNNAPQITTSGEESTGDTVHLSASADDTTDVEHIAITKENGDPAYSVQIVLGEATNYEAKTTSTFSYFDLPKYDTTGAVVQYQVTETWVKWEDNKWVAVEDSDLPKDLQEVWDEFKVSTKETYTPHNDISTESDEGEGVYPSLTDRDTQNIEVVNARDRVKNVRWYKEWRDHFAADNRNRPDLYLDIYSVEHEEKDGTISEVIKLVKRNYRWQVVTPQETTQETMVLFDEGTGENVNTLVDVTEEAANDVWSVTLNDVPKYDKLGHEITYFAVERTQVHVSNFDYQAVKYAMGKDGPGENIIGNRDGKGENDTDVKDQDNFKNITLDLTSKGWANDADKPTNIGDFDDTEGSGNTYPKYALVEGGTFINTLADTFAITGVKLWENMPGAYMNNSPDLPKVTFKVYSFTTAAPTDEEKEAAAENEPAATLTIEPEDWAEIRSGSSYSFRIEYQGANVVDDEGNFVQAEGNTQGKLPLYDKNGRRLYYFVQEVMDIDGDKQVYDVKDAMSSTFTFTNTYKPETGSLRVKKLLELPVDTTSENGGFPELKFTLKRSYTNSEGAATEPETVETVTVESSEVKEAFDDAEKEGKETVVLTFDDIVFEDLPLYAPNGSEYTYTVKETGDLGGYETYAETGNLEVSDFENSEKESTEVGNLTPEQTTDGTEQKLDVQATFYNKRESDQETVTLQGTKQWEDYGNAMGTRPPFQEGEITEQQKDPLNLQVTRTAGSVNQTLNLGTDYTVTYTGNQDNTWTFTIQGVEDSGELERYASNGKEWIYTVTEQGGGWQSQYKSSGSWITTGQKPTGDGNTITMGPVTNSIYTKVGFDKKWVDVNDQPVSATYINFPVTVTYKLQVKPGENGTWQDAEDYFGDLDEAVKKAITGQVKATGWSLDSDGSFTVTKTNKVDAAWKGSFTGLPKVVRADNKTTNLTYRVVETAVSYGEEGKKSQNFEIQSGNTYQVNNEKGGNLVSSATFESTTNTTTNKLAATSITVEKVWVDNDNAYATRPDPQGGTYTWEAWFVVQRSSDDGTGWTNFALITLYGHDIKEDGDQWEKTLYGLPTVNYQGEGTYTYRVRELKPNLDADGKVIGYNSVNEIGDGQIVPDNGVYAQTGKFDYTTGYEQNSNNPTEWTVTNKLHVQARKVSVTKVWKNGQNTAPDNASVTVQLQYRLQKNGTWTEWEDIGEAVTLSGDKWTHTWNNLPDQIGGDPNTVIEYRVVESNVKPEDNITLPAEYEVVDGENDETTLAFTITNVEPTEFTVTKKWNDGETTTNRPGSITVALYRTTEQTKVGTTDEEKVPTDELTGKTQREATLNAVGNWTATFNELPKYNAAGQPYIYYALELVDGTPVKNKGSATYENQDYHVDVGTDVNGNGLITNTPAISIEGTKKWLDNGNEDNTRPEQPEDFTLTLKQNGEEVTDLAAQGIKFEWSGTDNSDNQWTYTFSNLPKYDPQGNLYTYTVTEENVPGGYVETSQGKGVDLDPQEEGKGPTFTNLLTGKINIKGTKTWEDGDDTGRPKNITLTLQRRLVTETGESAWKDVDDVVVEWTKPEEETGAEDTEGDPATQDDPAEPTDPNTWKYKFENLDMFDDQGVKYVYRVVETTPNGYHVYYEDGKAGCDVEQMDIRNVKTGGLTVTKTVTGNRGNRNQDFDFTVTFTLPEGFWAGNEALKIGYTSPDGSTGEIEVEKDTYTVTHEFKLSHGEKITFTGVPGSTTYVVTETNSYGHSVSYTGQSGAVPPGSTAETAVTNHSSYYPPDDPDPDEPDEPDPDDPDEPDDPDVDIPDDPTPGEDPDPDDPDNPDEPDDPDVDIPDDPTPGDDPDPDKPDDKPNTPGKDDDKPTLPQTGQLWWPVLPLMATGALLLLAGMWRRKTYHAKHYQR